MTQMTVNCLYTLPRAENLDILANWELFLAQYKGQGQGQIQILERSYSCDRCLRRPILRWGKGYKHRKLSLMNSTLGVTKQRIEIQTRKRCSRHRLLLWLEITRGGRNLKSGKKVGKL